MNKPRISDSRIAFLCQYPHDRHGAPVDAIPRDHEGIVTSYCTDAETRLLAEEVREHRFAAVCASAPPPPPTPDPEIEALQRLVSRSAVMVEALRAEVRVVLSEIKRAPARKQPASKRTAKKKGARRAR